MLWPCKAGPQCKSWSFGAPFKGFGKLFRGRNRPCNTLYSLSPIYIYIYIYLCMCMDQRPPSFAPQALPVSSGQVSEPGGGQGATYSKWKASGLHKNTFNPVLFSLKTTFNYWLLSIICDFRPFMGYLRSIKGYVQSIRGYFEIPWLFWASWLSRYI